MQTIEAAVDSTGKLSGLQQPIIDCDIHHNTSLKVIKPYLPRAFAEFMTTYGAAIPSGTPSGGAAKSAATLAELQEKHLDPNNIKYGILTAESYGTQGVGNYDYAAAICSAINDYTLEHWLSQDKRLKGSLIVTKQAPHLAAKEIDRLAASGSWAQVIFTSGSQVPYGNRYYDPVYEACVRHNLPIMIHGGMEGAGVNSPTTGAGYVTYLAEWKAARTQAMMAHLASLIFDGAFERFPDLRFVLNESGAFWVAPYVWRLDIDWKSLRVQTPWVSKLPSEYFRQFFRVTTQSLEKTPDDAVFQQYMDSIFAKETMMFCSNYPYEELGSQIERWPAIDSELNERIMYKNAAALYGLN